MDRFHISKKFYGTLAMRVLLGSVLLLAIPVILYSFFIYSQEEKENRRNVLIALNVMAQNRVQMIEERLQFQKRWLAHMAEHNIILIPIRFSQAFRLERNSNNQWVVRDSSDPKMDNQVIFHEKEFDMAMKGGRFFNLVAYNPYISDYAFFLGLKVGNENDPSVVYVGMTPLTVFIEPFSGTEDLQFSTERSLVNDRGMILQSSNADWIGKNIKNMIVKQYIDKSLLGKKVEAFVIQGQELNYAIRVPIPDTHVALMLDAPKTHLFKSQAKSILFKIGALWLIILIVGGSCAVLLTWRLSKPLLQLSQIMQKTAEGDTTIRYKDDSMGFEINQLGRQFNDMIESMLKHQEEAELQRAQKERFAEELKIGRKIQKSLFPTHVPELEGIDIAAGFVPARDVAGDFYDVFTINDQLMVVIADAAGKGVQACLYSLGMRSMLRSFAVSSPDLKEIVNKSNHLFCRDSGLSSVFVTLWIGILNLKTLEMEYCSAGHHPGLLKRSDGSILHLQTAGIALGAEESIDINTENITLQVGDSLLLYTDGVVEAENPHGKFYGAPKLLEFMKGSSVESAEKVIEELSSDVEQFRDNTPLPDDLTVLSLIIQRHQDKA